MCCLQQIMDEVESWPASIMTIIFREMLSCVLKVYVKNSSNINYR